MITTFPSSELFPRLFNKCLSMPRRNYRSRRPRRRRLRRVRPLRKRTYRKRKVRMLKRKANVRSRFSRPSYLGQIFPTRLRVKLPYFDVLQVSDGTVATSIFELQQIRLNGPASLDPNTIGMLPHQPRGWDQLIALYDRYLVRGTRYNFRFYCADDAAVTTKAANLICGLRIAVSGESADYPDDATGTNESLVSIMEEPQDKYYAKWRYLSRNTAMVNSAQSSFTSKSSVIQGYVSHHKVARDYAFSGVGSSSTHFVWPDDYQAEISQTPLAATFANLWVSSLPQDSAPGEIAMPAVMACMKLTFYIEFRSRIHPAQS